jgi:predicted Ser/Thr protein kinase
MNTKVLGEGYFGKVFNVPVDECIKNIPAGVKRVGVKVEKLKTPFEASQTPNRVKEVIEIAKKANELNVGPALYDVFVVVNAAGYTQIIKCFEIIDGKSWRDTEWTPAKKTAALKKLDAHVHKLNKAGIIHHDLHDGNVMVSQTGEVYIIDYDLARFVDFEEENIVARFNDSENQWEPKGAASREGTYYVFTKLIEEGSIVLPSSAPPNANKANSSNNSGQSKRGTAKAKKGKKAKNA